ncbi:MAG TPA: hypothetical protein VNL69_10690 [Bacteroidota bacterium]|nr:hypothetical protein [Bacteroidota bacterium]
MQWKTVVTLGVFGLLMGIASVFGYTEGAETVLWIAIALFAAYWLEKHVEQRLLVHGICAGVLIGFINSIVQAAFFSSYLANNPLAAKGFVDTGGVAPRVFVVVVGTLIGFVYGLVLGGLALAARKLLARRTRSDF